MTVGQNIKQRRLELKLTQTDLAKRVGVANKASISRVESGKEDLTSERVRRYAEALSCSPAYLMGWEEDSCDTLVRAYKAAKTKDKKLICDILEIPLID